MLPVRTDDEIELATAPAGELDGCRPIGRLRYGTHGIAEYRLDVIADARLIRSATSSVVPRMSTACPPVLSSAARSTSET